MAKVDFCLLKAKAALTQQVLRLSSKFFYTSLYVHVCVCVLCVCVRSFLCHFVNEFEGEGLAAAL